MFQEKSVHDITVTDLEEIIGEQTPENDRLEFKGGLSSDKRHPDEWTPGRYVVTDKAKEGIIKHLVAFANTNGGRLILGMSESDTQPRYAKAISPVENAQVLLERLLDCIQDSVEPKMINFESKCIQVNSDGQGVLVFSVPRSLFAPHRFTLTKECYARFGSTTKKMSMSEIQMSTLHTNRHIVEGLWTAKFQMPGMPASGCVVVLEAGKLFGGDSYYYYTGHYEVDSEGSVQAKASIVHYAGPIGDIFGGQEKAYNVKMVGKVSGNSIDCTFNKEMMPSKISRLTLYRRENLP